MEVGRDVEGQQQLQQRRLVMVHSQVRRIKQEAGEKVKVDETYQNQVSEMRRLALQDMEARQRSRSPLGRATRPAISIGGDS